MSEYWKSQPRKFCDACKCWFGDNRASIEFHERGKRHQDNVKKRLDLLRKKGQRDHKAKIKYDGQIHKIEAEAMKAFKNDVKNDPKLAEQCLATVQAALEAAAEKKLQTPTGVSIRETKYRMPDKSKVHPTTCNALIPLASGSAKPVVPPPIAPKPIVPKVGKRLQAVVCPWFEAKYEETSYYWNVETGETMWEQPVKFVTLEEQERIRERTPEIPIHYGPPIKSSPYGEWEVVEKKVEEQIDWQLPEGPKDEEYTTITFTNEEKFSKFKEKTVESLSGNKEPAVFKKRKNLAEAKKRNVRQRIDDSID